jgi:hypothetical protein
MDELFKSLNDPDAAAALQKSFGSELGMPAAAPQQQAA